MPAFYLAQSSRPAGKRRVRLGKNAGKDARHTQKLVRHLPVAKGYLCLRVSSRMSLPCRLLFLGGKGLQGTSFDVIGVLVVTTARCTPPSCLSYVIFLSRELGAVQFGLS